MVIKYEILVTPKQLPVKYIKYIEVLGGKVALIFEKCSSDKAIKQ